MAKSERQKLKLLYIKQFLEEKSDEQHPVTVQQILDELQAHDISAERKSIYSDIACLQDFGMDVVQLRGRNGGYYLADRTFELSELKLLVDAVQASKFLTERKSVSLIQKLGTLVSNYDSGKLRRQVMVSGRVKTMNESIFYNVDRIHEAIAANEQISFRYFEWGVNKEKIFREHTYTASPIALFWAEQNYYLIALTDRHGITHFRVDKMAGIKLLSVARISNEQTQSVKLADYSKNVFGMYGGEHIMLKLRFANSLAGVVLNRFGHDIMLIPDGDSHFVFNAPIVVSNQFFGWLAAFGDQAKILYPESVAAQFSELCKLCAEQYHT